MTTILVTGGAGYIGSHTCKSLFHAGYLPVVYDNLSTGHKELVKWGPLEEGDIADRQRLDEVINKHRPAAVLHFAASAYVGESVLDPGKYYRNNVAGSLTLLEAMRDHGIGRIVFSSTCAVYGEPEVCLITEDTLPAPVNPYGASKLMIERMLKDFGHAHGVRYISLRYFNAAGADPEGDTGEDHSPETHLLPLVVQAALGQRPGIDVYGTDYSTPDGTAIRDYIHVTDLTSAHVKALEYISDGRPNTAVNLGTGRGHSVLEVIRTVESVSGASFPINFAPRRAGDPSILVADSGKAAKLLGWQPEFPALEDMVSTALCWHSARNANRQETF